MRHILKQLHLREYEVSRARLVTLKIATRASGNKIHKEDRGQDHFSRQEAKDKYLNYLRIKNVPPQW